MRAEVIQRCRELGLTAVIGGVQNDGPQSRVRDIGQSLGRAGHEQLGGVTGHAVVGPEAGEENAGGGRLVGFHGLSSA